MKEIWKDIEGYKTYQISNLGRVRRKRKIATDSSGTYSEKIKFLKTHKMKAGYLAIVLRDSEQKKHLLKIHRLVAKAFIPNPNNYPFVNHIDGDKSNSVMENLEWCTAKQNTEHAKRIGLIKGCSGRNIQRIYKININTKQVENVYETFSEAAKKNGLNSCGSIYSACSKKISYGGFYWIRENDYKNGRLKDFSKGRINHRLEYNGEIITACEYAKRIGVSMYRISKMINEGELKEVPLQEQEETL